MSTAKTTLSMSANGKAKIPILGGGMTGLAAGWATGFTVYEAEEAPGGICSSYYVRPDTRERFHSAPEDGEAYRFEIGGGHWIFGGDPAVLRFIRSLTPVKAYQRRSSVFFPDQNLHVPYPLQNHLGYLDKETRVKALTEMLTTPKGNPKTMAAWLEQSFGSTLTETFFGPFHQLYTAGLWCRIAPQDGYKSPVDGSLIIRGASDQTPPVGYNVSYLYPEDGLNTFAQRMANQCDIRYRKRAAKMDVRTKEVHFDDGSGAKYDSIISTLSLHKMVEMTGLQVDEEPDPYTSVLVLNIGAIRGPRCPSDHWLYLAGSKSLFHRIGFYSNVDVSFLPKSSREFNGRVSIYVERAFPGGLKPPQNEIKDYAVSVIKELQGWEFIGEAEVVDPTWIDVAYTWSWPGSKWRTKALKRMEENDILMVGRYGRWIFQGIADSIRDGLFVGASARAHPAHFVQESLLPKDLQESLPLVRD